MKNIVILYKNKKYKIIPHKKLKSKDLTSSSIETIFIPLYDNPNAYIPIKSSTLYDFTKATVSIIYQPFIYDNEDQNGVSYTIREFYAECKTIGDFINAIYNCYKFRGVSIFLDENSVFSSMRPLNFAMVLRRIQIKFFDDKNDIIHEIDSNVMEDLSDYKVLENIPAYLCEDRMNCLRDMLYVPDDIDNSGEADIRKLPICIKLSDDYTWKKISKPGKQLNFDDCILYNIPDFEIYYLMTYEVYHKLIDFPSFTAYYIGTPVSKGYDEDYFPSLDNNKIPSIYEKDEVYDALRFDNIFSITNTVADIDRVDIFLEALIFSETILNYIKYYAKYCYAEDDTSIIIRSFIVLERLYPSGEPRQHILLTDLEINYDSINESFLKFIMNRG